MKDGNKIKYSWVCPTCGAVMPTEQTTCTYCVPTKNPPYIAVDYTKTISQTESHYDEQLGGSENEK